MDRENYTCYIGTEVASFIHRPTSSHSVIRCRYSVRVHISVALLSPIFIEIHFTYVRFRIPARQTFDTVHKPLCQDVTRDAIYISRFLNIKCSQPCTIYTVRFKSLGRKKYQLQYNRNHFQTPHPGIALIWHMVEFLNRCSLCFRRHDSEREAEDSNAFDYFTYYYYYYIIIFFFFFMQGIHTYIPETNHVSRVHSVAAIQREMLVVHIALSAILNSFVLLHYYYYYYYYYY
jgi:hypothetical protein